MSCDPSAPAKSRVASEAVPTSSSATTAEALCPPLTDELELAFCQLVGSLAQGDAERVVSRFEPGLQRSLTTSRLKSAWADETRGLGALSQIRRLAAYPARDGSRIQLVLRFGRGERMVEGVVRTSGTVAALAFGPAPRPWETPSYVRRDEFEERDITVGREPVLPGRLTLPKRSGRAPAVLIAHGSGLSDEDCSAHPSGLGSKLCKDLAWGLSSQGLVVLRYRKRVLVDPKPLPDLDAEVVRDACAARSLLAGRDEVEPRRIVLVGHSLGAALAPRIARTCGGFAGLVLVNGPARPLVEVLSGQVAYVGWRAGTPELTAERVAALRAAVQHVETTGADPHEPVELLGSTAPRSYWRDTFRLDPTREVAGLELPIFVVQGERDYQVGLVDYDRWRATLQKRRNVRFERYPALDHLLARGTGPSSHFDYYLARHVDSRVISDLVDWIRALPTRY